MEINTQDISPEILFRPFRASIGKCYDKVCNDTKAMLGRLDKDIKVKNQGWKAGSKGAIENKYGLKLQLPLNNPASLLILFALQIQHLARNAEFGGEYKEGHDGGVQNEGVICKLPASCINWIEQENKSLGKKQETTEPVAA